MIAQHPTYTAHKIQECWRGHVKKYQMQLHGWKDEYQFHEYARTPDNGNFLTDIDFNTPVATINNIRKNMRGTKWRYHENETKSPGAAFAGNSARRATRITSEFEYASAYITRRESCLRHVLCGHVMLSSLATNGVHPP